MKKIFLLICLLVFPTRSSAQQWMCDDFASEFGSDSICEMFDDRVLMDKTDPAYDSETGVFIINGKTWGPSGCFDESGVGWGPLPSGFGIIQNDAWLHGGFLHVASSEDGCEDYSCYCGIYTPKINNEAATTYIHLILQAYDLEDTYLGSPQGIQVILKAYTDNNLGGVKFLHDGTGQTMNIAVSQYYNGFSDYVRGSKAFDVTKPYHIWIRYKPQTSDTSDDDKLDVWVTPLNDNGGSSFK